MKTSPALLKRRVRFYLLPLLFLSFANEIPAQGLNLSIEKGNNWKFSDGTNTTSNSSITGFNIGANGYKYGFQIGCRIGFDRGNFAFANQPQYSFKSTQFMFDFNWVPDKGGEHYSVAPILTFGGGGEFFTSDFFQDQTGTVTAGGLGIEIGGGIYIGRTTYYKDHGDRFNMLGFFAEGIYESRSVSADLETSNYDTYTKNLDFSGLGIRFGIRVVMNGRIES